MFFRKSRQAQLGRELGDMIGPESKLLNRIRYSQG